MINGNEVKQKPEPHILALYNGDMLFHVDDDLTKEWDIDRAVIMPRNGEEFFEGSWFILQVSPRLGSPPMKTYHLLLRSVHEGCRHNHVAVPITLSHFELGCLDMDDVYYDDGALVNAPGFVPGSAFRNRAGNTFFGSLTMEGFVKYESHDN